MAISRRTWGARGSVDRDSNPKRELFIHHTVTAGGKLKWTRAEERAHMRLLENIHMGQGWDTVGYSFILFPSGRLYEGRGAHGHPAAQVGHNAGTLSISCVGDYRFQHLTRAQKRRLIKSAKTMRKNHSQLRSVGGHQDAPGQSTSCPGPHIMGFLNELARKSGLRRDN